MNGRSLLTGVTALLALIGLGATCLAAEFDTVRDRIRQYIDKEGVPSISIAVVKGDKIVWEDGFGWADVENRVRATPHTAYMLGSEDVSNTRPLPKSAKNESIEAVVAPVVRCAVEPAASPDGKTGKNWEVSIIGLSWG